MSEEKQRISRLPVVGISRMENLSENQQIRKRVWANSQTAEHWILILNITFPLGVFASLREMPYPLFFLIRKIREIRSWLLCASVLFFPFLSF